MANCMQASVFLPKIQHFKYLKSVFLNIYNCALNVAFLKSGQKLYLVQACNQIMLDEASKQLTAINAYCGLYCWCRLPFGVAASLAIFQGIMVRFCMDYIV